MSLDLDDGYTLSGQTKTDHGEYHNLPVVGFRYRPALWPELAAFRRAALSTGEVDATSQMVVDHVVSWDVTIKGKPAPVSAEVVRKLPEPILNQIFQAVTTWAPKEQETAEKNSGPGAD